MMISQTIGFIGAGNMAQAIGLRLIEAGVVPAKQVVASAPSTRNIGCWSEAGALATSNNNEVINLSDIVFLAMKPQFLAEAVASLSLVPSSKIYVSILAGISLASLEKTLSSRPKSGDQNLRIVKVMPNTPILVGAGCSVMCANSYVLEEEISLIQKIMSAGGICEVIPESQFNSISALSGSGPAFIFMVIEALADGAVLRGVPRALALKLAAKMVEGAGRLVAETGKHPGQLKDEVCSPGGTTIVGVKRLEEAGIRHAFMSAVQSSGEKADALAALFK